MDTAKVVALHAVNGGDVLALGYHREDLAPGLPRRRRPDDRRDRGRDEHLRRDHRRGPPAQGLRRPPERAAAGDRPRPRADVGLPPAATAATGVDALTHSLESLLSRNPNPFAEAMALQVIRTVAAVAARGGRRRREPGSAVADAHGVPPRGPRPGERHRRGRGPRDRPRDRDARGARPWHGPRDGAARGAQDATSAFASASSPCRRRARGRGPADPPGRGCPAPRSTGLEGFLRQVGQRRTLRELGLGPRAQPLVVADAVDDAAIANSPRIPSADEIAAILATVSGA